VIWRKICRLRDWLREVQTVTTKIFEGMKASEVVEVFLEWLSETKEVQENHWKVVVQEDNRVQDFLHAFEFEENSKKRGPLATQFHESRNLRRNAKDRAHELKPIKDYMDDATCKAHIKRLKRLQADLAKEEQFIASERVYKPRAVETENQ
jgi:hypothetical protein